MIRLSQITFVSILLLTPVSVFAQGKLPDGAIARLGDYRFAPFAVVETLAFSPDGKFLVSGDWEGRVTLWDAQTGTGHPLMSFGNKVNDVSFSPDGKLIGAGSSNGSFTVIDWKTKQIVLRSPHVERHGYQDIAFSPDGKSVATSSGPGWVYLWDLATGNKATSIYASHTPSMYPLVGFL